MFEREIEVNAGWKKSKGIAYYISFNAHSNRQCYIQFIDGEKNSCSLTLNDLNPKCTICLQGYLVSILFSHSFYMPGFAKTAVIKKLMLVGYTWRHIVIGENTDRVYAADTRPQSLTEMTVSCVEGTFLRHNQFPLN